jgi:hypothetical protein
MSAATEENTMSIPRNDFADEGRSIRDDGDARYDERREDELFGGEEPPQSEASARADLEDAAAQVAMIRNGWRF